MILRCYYFLNGQKNSIKFAYFLQKKFQGKISSSFKVLQKLERRIFLWNLNFIKIMNIRKYIDKQKEAELLSSTSFCLTGLIVFI